MKNKKGYYTVHVMIVEILVRFSVNPCNFYIDILIVSVDTGGELEASFHVKTQVCSHFQVKELPFWHPHFLLC